VQTTEANWGMRLVTAKDGAAVVLTNLKRKNTAEAAEISQSNKN
jgi:hypothetical protein